ncbi:MAG: FAD-dependent thymidylate synthase [Tissierellia bacterium]|nr:FAD-dependent thymidylate synthase [Tissierellia bacterium]
MKVELIRYTPDGEKLIAACAKLCYSKSGATDIEEGLSPEKTKAFLDRLVEMGHESPLEHVSFTFAVEGVSRTLTHQLVRHRLASYSQQSQRYVKVDDFQYIVPPAIRKNKKAYEIYQKHMEQSMAAYDQIVHILEEEYMEKSGKDEKQVEKVSIEDARYVFPNGTETKIVFTMNARSLMNFFRHRCCNRAQWEIRELAIQVLNQVQNIYPTLFHKQGPPCLQGPCPEGPMTCNKIKEVRAYFKNLEENGI